MGLSSPAVAETYSRVFVGDYSKVWKGLLIALAKYPLNKNDQESGEIVTSVLKAGEVFTPFEADPHPKEYYQIFIEVQKATYQGRSIVKVKVEKKPFLKGDFMNSRKELTSDGIEESLLLYRTAREIKIDKTIEKLFN